MKVCATACLCLLALLATPGRAGDDAEADAEAGSHWFYMVKTRPTDPSREAEFNAWYDDIDIPDVLAVPGFRRARRGVGEQLAAWPDADLEPREGKYVALYDIVSADIDKSIIDLYVAARRMSAFGRDTELLKVVEANYYRRLASAGAASVDSERSVYLYLQKILCCEDVGARTAFLDWYRAEFEPVAASTRGVRGSSLFAFYRAMEDWALGSEEIPHLLVVVELELPDAAGAMRVAQPIVGMLERGAEAVPFARGDATLYRQISEVKSR